MKAAIGLQFATGQLYDKPISAPPVPVYTDGTPGGRLLCRHLDGRPDAVAEHRSRVGSTQSVHSKSETTCAGYQQRRDWLHVYRLTAIAGTARRLFRPTRRQDTLRSSEDAFDEVAAEFGQTEIGILQPMDQPRLAVRCSATVILASHNRRCGSRDFHTMLLKLAEQHCGFLTNKRVFRNILDANQRRLG